MSKEYAKKTVCIKLNTKVNKLENKIPVASILIQTNQYKTEKQNLENLQIGDIENEIS